MCYPGFLSGTCRPAFVGLRCLWIPRSCGVHGLHDWVTCLRSGLCSSSVRDRDEDFPSFWWVWFLAFVQDPLPQAGTVFFGMRWSWRLSLLLTGWSCSFALGSSSLDLVGVGGFNRFPSPLYSFGMWSPFGSIVSFCHSCSRTKAYIGGCFFSNIATHFGVVSSYSYVLFRFVGTPSS